MERMIEKVRLTGVQIQKNGLNLCFIDGCKNDAMTSVQGIPVNWEAHVCGWHLKEKLESGEWKIQTAEEKDR